MITRRRGEGIKRVGAMERKGGEERWGNPLPYGEGGLPSPLLEVIKRSYNPPGHGS